MKLIGIGYRKWAIEIYKNISKKKKIKIFQTKKIPIKKINKINPDYIFFYGWSWKVSNTITKKYKCIMLHPSKLPKFAGGSPIQNQIIRNVNNSAITIFRMNNIIDGGNIIFQKKFSLKGSLDDIFERIIKVGTQLTFDLIKKRYVEKRIIVNKKYKRLKPANSEITINEIKNSNGIYLYNKIRMLQDPYPNPYIKTKDNKKLIIKKVILK